MLTSSIIIRTTARGSCPITQAAYNHPSRKSCSHSSCAEHNTAGDGCHDDDTCQQSRTWKQSDHSALSLDVPSSHGDVSKRRKDRYVRHRQTSRTGFCRRYERAELREGGHRMSVCLWQRRSRGFPAGPVRQTCFRLFRPAISRHLLFPKKFICQPGVIVAGAGRRKRHGPRASISEDRKPGLAATWPVQRAAEPATSAKLTLRMASAAIGCVRWIAGQTAATSGVLKAASPAT